MSKTKTPSEIKDLLEGPVSSIPTPFLRDGEVDWKGVRNIIETGISGGSGVSLLTYGDSQFEFLSDDEVARLTRILVEQAKGRALTVAANRRWWTGKTVEFARYCRELGADVLMVLPPAQATAVKGLIEYYRAAAEVMPVMLVGAPSYEVLDGLVGVPNICCFKEDGTEAYAVETMARYGENWKFMTGGGLWRNFTQWPVGCSAFMCVFSSFAPQVGQCYWKAFQAGDPAAAGKIIRDFDRPFFSLGEKFPAGLHAAWHATLELKGIASRWLRPPALSLTDKEMERLSEMLDEMELLTG